MKCGLSTLYTTKKEYTERKYGCKILNFNDILKIKIWETNTHSYAVITNLKTKRYGCVVPRKEAEIITTRKYYPYSKDNNYWYDVSWIPNYMIDEAVVLLNELKV